MKYSAKEFASAQQNVLGALELLKSILTDYNNLVLNSPSYDFKGKTSLIDLNDKATEIVVYLNQEVQRIQDALITICEESIGFKEDYNSLLQNCKSNYNFDNVFLDENEVRDYLLVYYETHKDSLTEEQRAEFTKLLYDEADERLKNEAKNATLLEKCGGVPVSIFSAAGLGVIDFLENGVDILASVGCIFVRDSKWIHEMIASDAAAPFANYKITDYSDLKEYEDSFRFYFNSTSFEPFMINDETQDDGTGVAITKVTASYVCSLVASYITGFDSKIFIGLYSGTGAKLQKTYESALEDGEVTIGEEFKNLFQSISKGAIDYGILSGADYVAGGIVGNYANKIDLTTIEKYLSSSGTQEFIKVLVKSAKPILSTSVDSLLFGEDYDIEDVKNQTYATFIPEATFGGIKVNLSANADYETIRNINVSKNAQKFAETQSSMLSQSFKMDSNQAQSFGFSKNIYNNINRVYSSDILGKSIQKGSKEITKAVYNTVNEGE